MTHAERNAQIAQNLSYVMGIYGGTIKMLLEELKNPGTQSYRESVIEVAERMLDKGEAIFKVHGERTYDEVLAEIEGK